MRVGVVTFPGSNCDEDMRHALRELGADVVQLWHKDSDLQQVEAVVLPGGFSYGDYLRSGAIARFSPIMTEVKRFAESGGLVFGVCNGFQILCEAGLLPGALLHNQSHRFICSDVSIAPVGQPSRITEKLDASKTYRIPIAHGEGRFYADDATLDALEANGQVLFRYVDGEGQPTSEANPNGASRNIAGICNSGRNVFGMMPHPERAASAIVGNTDGVGILQGFLG